MTYLQTYFCFSNPLPFHSTAVTALFPSTKTKPLAFTPGVLSVFILSHFPPFLYHRGPKSSQEETVVQDSVLCRRKGKRIHLGTLKG